MIWVDREVKKLKERAFPLEWIDDMKTPSGRIHVGSLRGVLIHDLVYKVLKREGIKTRFSYVFNNMDPMDGLPTYLEKEKWERYMGVPLYKIPSPEKGFRNFSEYYAKEFISVFNSINCHPEIIWSSNLYETGKFNDVIKKFLDNANIVRDIYRRVAKANRPDTWFPFNVICEKCGKIGTTNVYKWDGNYVYYRCESDMVQWAKGCGYEGKITPYDGHGKLPWKLDWAAHWKILGVTIEGSGKDHMSAGGSYEMASAFCKEILDYSPPHAIGYEWFTIGGRKMSSSKGIGTSAKDASQILPPEVFRFLLVRTHVETHLDFNPFGDTIPNLFDDYDRCMNAYFSKIENKLPKEKQGEVMEDFARIIELSEVRSHPKKRILLPRFRTVANLLKNKTDVGVFFEEQKGSKLTNEEQEILDERITYAKLYLENYAEEKTNGIEAKERIFVLSNNQKLFLIELKKMLEKSTKPSRKELQNIIFSLLKERGLKPKEVFQAFYQTLMGRGFGPKAPDVILDLGIKKTIDHIEKSLNQKSLETPQKKSRFLFPNLDDKSIFSISSNVKKQYPSICIGIAIIKGVAVKKSNDALNKRIQEFASTQSNLTSEVIGSYSEIQSYRRIYKDTGIDWHSRRPSPEALLRRIALKKGLYQINTCVDAYNLVVMKNRVSSGAFDLDKIKFPTVLRHSKVGEEILLIGDTEPTKYKPGELAYFDQIGGYNIDFNYRDAKRTAVTEQTTNLLINIDGAYDISREMVEKTLKETVEEITRYCGGKVETAGISTTG